MTWIFMIGITLVVALMTLYEWPRMKPNQKKEKYAFVIMVAMEWFLAILLLFYPDLPGPTQIIEDLFRPFRKLLKE